ncbi:MAG: low molecular weight protein-tyrosine-phosphatase, partial [Pseudomonadota bacterium]
MPRLLFVCLGNICRSPAADGIARRMAADRGLDWYIDSAGTGAWHVGNPPDPRMIEAAAMRGIDLTPLHARQAEPDDFLRFDHIFAMDRSNLADLSAIRPSNAPASLDLFLGDADVPDPYY